MAVHWYVVQTYSGYEGRVQKSLQEKVRVLALDERIRQVLIPTEEVVEMQQGKKRVATRKFYPGYILVEMEVDDETWHVVNDIPKVTGFLGGKVPTPLSESELKEILHQVEEGEHAPARPKVSYAVGDMVKINDGPFVGFNANVDELDFEHGKVKVMISIFGRQTPVELDFLQVEKVSG
jgi:transcriptional antiterminator NusG